MDDVRRAALERASRAKKAPVGTSFESERQRSKNALVKQISSQDGRNVRMIAAATEAPEEERILRVAAYCRVSTDDIDQKLSIQLQIQQYTKKIKENPNWRYAGCYVDDGFSGTNTDHRQGFQKLMKDAMDGKIDMIITKAVSRFARNLMDCIGWVDALQNHDPPVRVYFEQENLDTMAQTSGIILFVLAMVAQEESHMEERFQQAVEANKKLFGVPVFRHESGVRGLGEVGDGGEWDMMTEARPLDITHTMDTGVVDDLLLEIMEDPPTLPQSSPAFSADAIVVESTGEEV